MTILTGEILLAWLHGDVGHWLIGISAILAGVLMAIVSVFRIGFVRQL